MSYPKPLALWASLVVAMSTAFLACHSINTAPGDTTLDPKPNDSPSLKANRPATARPFYGMQFVPIDELDMVRGLGIEVILESFERDAPPEEWLAYLDEAQALGIQVVAWLWPPGWHWDGSEWEIPNRDREFIEAVAYHPALFAVYSLHEPYWMGCRGCGYTTAEQQALYDAIKAIAEVPIWSDVDSISLWTAHSEETAFADLAYLP